jgi:hypothetical protein
MMAGSGGGGAVMGCGTHQQVPYPSRSSDLSCATLLVPDACFVGLGHSVDDMEPPYIAGSGRSGGVLSAYVNHDFHNSWVLALVIVTWHSTSITPATEPCRHFV